MPKITSFESDYKTALKHVRTLLKRWKAELENEPTDIAAKTKILVDIVTLQRGLWKDIARDASKFLLVENQITDEEQALMLEYIRARDKT